ncbi:hypothetical protein ACFL6M_01045 [Candidatus Eisenbacteria bacterium]|uniref:Uncharacterized protein n=1 Tax=Eiseniibacteriota bacterium TaxID=2212470 RepID=A0ABV6YIJ7_UNCEI
MGKKRDPLIAPGAGTLGAVIRREPAGELQLGANEADAYRGNESGALRFFISPLPVIQRRSVLCYILVRSPRTKKEKQTR